jgi:hypothetical protein
MAETASARAPLYPVAAANGTGEQVSVNPTRRPYPPETARMARHEAPQSIRDRPDRAHGSW